MPEIDTDTMSQANNLVEILSEAQSLAIICHDNPDPDCIASALGLKKIAENSGVEEIKIYYSGEVSHQQNRAFVNLLDVDLINFNEADLNDYDKVAFVDHSIPSGNNQVSPERRIDVVIDHHPSEEDVVGEFVDVREDYGATTTIIVEYLKDLEMSPDQNLATALLFGIRTETLDFLRDATEKEYSAAMYLHSLVDIDLLKRMIQPAFSPATLDTIGQAIINREVRASALISGVGRTTERDALPQAADYLMNLEGISTVLVFGIIEDKIQMSARSNDSRVNLNRIVREAFGDVGSAGGHQDMAGAQIPLGIFSDMVENDSKLIELTSDIVRTRFFKAMNLHEDEPEATNGA